MFSPTPWRARRRLRAGSFVTTRASTFTEKSRPSSVNSQRYGGASFQLMQVWWTRSRGCSGAGCRAKNEGEPTTISRRSPETGTAIMSCSFEYYVADRGRHPRSIGGFTVTSAMSHINAGALSHLEDIAPRRILLITGDRAHSRYFSDTVHDRTRGWSELVVVPGARHIDLYDRTDLIP
jgi:hypothetical protein